MRLIKFRALQLMARIYTRRDLYSFWKRTLPASAKYRVMIFWYNFLSRFQTGDDVLFLNHGLAPSAGNPEKLVLSEKDEKHRYAIQLYSFLCSSLDWTDKNVLEVSSGRGGGTDWLIRTFHPKTVIGLDIAKFSTHFCRRYYSHPNLSFETGDAQSMPFDDCSFDIVINVESSLNYPDFDSYLSEVNRVLKPGGEFLIADYRRRAKIPQFRTALQQMGYGVNYIEDISDGIIRGLELSEAQKLSIIEKHVPRLLRGIVCRFARVTNDEDSEIELFRQGKKIYLAARLKKPL